jgi:dynein light intermediate chain
MFPSLNWESEGKNYKQIVSSNPPSREDVNTLQKMLDEKLVIRQARDSGICPIRE